jgi:hypothetical protein
MTRQEQKAAAFRALHAAEPFVVPNPRDPARRACSRRSPSQALATTSSRFAFTLGRRDREATLEEVVEHTAALDRATVLPLSVDLENGYGTATRDIARAVTRVADAGAVSCSIEDDDPSQGIGGTTATPSAPRQDVTNPGRREPPGDRTATHDRTLRENAGALGGPGGAAVHGAELAQLRVLHPYAALRPAPNVTMTSVAAGHPWWVEVRGFEPLASSVRASWG